MRGWAQLLPVLLVLCGACAQLPDIRPAPTAGELSLRQACRQPFPLGKWRFVHTVQAYLPGNASTVAVGISLIDPTAGAIQAVIVSLEGLTVFDAVENGQLTVTRALPPFDRPDFARGLMQDVKMVFFEPVGCCTAVGFLADGEAVCRYRNPSSGTADVRILSADRWEVQRYDAGNRLLRRLEGTLCTPPGADPSQSVPCRLTLTAYGRPGYRLSMDLVEAEKMEDSEK